MPAGDDGVRHETSACIRHLDLHSVAAILASYGLSAAASVTVGIVQGLLRKSVEAGLDGSGDVLREVLQLASYVCSGPAFVIASGQAKHVTRRSAAQLRQRQSGRHVSDLGQRLSQGPANP